MKRASWLIGVAAIGWVNLATSRLTAAEFPIVEKVEAQPIGAQAKRIAEALDYLGSPLAAADRERLANAIELNDVAKIQKALDPYCLAAVRIGAGNKMESQPGSAKLELIEQGWRVYLVKVLNDAAATKLELRAESPHALPVYKAGSFLPAPTVTSLGNVQDRFLDLDMFNSQPLTRQLSGLELEYRVLQVFCRDAGRREAKVGFGLYRPPVGRAQPQRVAGSNQESYLFSIAPAVVVKMQVLDHDGAPTMGSFTFRDAQKRVYPAMGKRLAPDFFFHSQIYRKDGETVILPPGKYQVIYSRGPEYLVLNREVTVPDKPTHSEKFELKRWTYAAAKGWYSGDHHVHAAGCAHYDSPTEGVTPEDMMRHILGEDLNVGCVLSWGPCWYHQKRYFEGKEHKLSQGNHIMRYDVEVSGFPSSHCGHICLLRLREQDYPGTKVIDDWPSWDLPILKWAKAQGAVVGFAHSGSGLEPEKQEDRNKRDLPNFFIPTMGGIGANEFFVDIAHDACDFISTVDTQPVWELNAWYHSLNAGYRCRISGETDFPCIYGEKVGLGRVYVHLDKKLNYDDWAEGIKNGRSYVSDGKSHLMDFAVNGHGVGTATKELDAKGQPFPKSEIRLEKPANVKVTANVAAWLEPQPTAETEKIRKAPLSINMLPDQTRAPYWHVERARIGSTRKVPVEVVVNGHAIATKEIEADGSTQTVEFDVPIKLSSWVCLRIFPTSHTNPVFVLVGDKEIRPSRKSVEWCLTCIDKCWKQKSPRIGTDSQGRKKPPEIAEKEKREAREAYDFAIAEYKKRLEESMAD